VIGRCADVVKLGYQWRKRVVIYVSEIIRVSLLVFNLFFVSMSSVYILLAICIIVGVNSDEHTHIVSSIISLYLPIKGRYESNFVCVVQSVLYFDSLQLMIRTK
jgi:Na+/H+ antiporter NhaA